MYSADLNRPDIKMATQISKIISNAEYKKGQGEMNKEPAVIGRPDFEHAVEASKLSSQIKYKEKFDNEMKVKKHHYNPLENASFRQSQLATALVSDREYRKLFEENKGMYHFDADAPEHLHHKGNATLQSQVKYKEEYEKNKGKSMLEFVETPSYQASKEAQKMQSETPDTEDLLCSQHPDSVGTPSYYFKGTEIADSSINRLRPQAKCARWAPSFLFSNNNTQTERNENFWTMKLS